MAIQGTTKSNTSTPALPSWSYNPKISNEQNEWNFFADQGFSPWVDAGILGNFQQESGFNPESVQPNGPGRGLAQWSEGGRWNPAFMTGNVGQDMTNQLHYVMSELQNPSYGLGSLEQTTSAQQAAQVFGSDYERYGIAGARVGDAGNVMQQALSGQWQGSSGSGNSSQLDQALNNAVAGQMLPGQIQSQGTQNQIGYNNQEYSNLIAQLEQQFGFQQQQFGISGGQLGIQQTQLGQELAHLLQQQGLSRQEYGLTQHGLNLEQQNLQQQFGISEKERQISQGQALGSMAASGVYNSGTRTTEQKQFGLQEAQAKQAFGYSEKQIDQARRQAYLSHVGQEQGYGYSQQQITNAKNQLALQFKQLGLNEQEAQAALQNALTNAGLQHVMTGDQLLTQLAMYQAGMPTAISGILSTIMSAAPMIGALVGQG